MKFPEKGHEKFKMEEIELLQKWKADLELSAEGKRILENIEKDSKVPKETWEKFLKNLAHRLNKGNKGFDAAINAIEDEMLLQGPLVKTEHIPEYLSKLVKARSLFRYLNDSLPVYRDKGAEKQLCKWITDKSLTVKTGFKNIKYRGIRPIVWATSADEIDKLKPINDDLDDLCDRLGLLDFDKCDDVIELRYESQKVKNVRIPTIMEGGQNPAFLPCDEDDDYGYTLGLKNDYWEGLPEIVHEPVDFHEIEFLHYLGHKEKNPVPFWEKGNKSIREESK